MPGLLSSWEEASAAGSLREDAVLNRSFNQRRFDLGINWQRQRDLRASPIAVRPAILCAQLRQIDACRRPPRITTRTACRAPRLRRKAAYPPGASRCRASTSTERSMTIRVLTIVVVEAGGADGYAPSPDGEAIVHPGGKQRRRSLTHSIRQPEQARKSLYSHWRGAGLPRCAMGFGGDDVAIAGVRFVRRPRSGSSSSLSSRACRIPNPGED